MENCYLWKAIIYGKLLFEQINGILYVVTSQTSFLMIDTPMISILIYVLNRPSKLIYFFW
jgi:hypothetical protein